MLGPIGMPELIIIMVIALIIFGPRKLPELGQVAGPESERVQEGIQRAQEHRSTRKSGSKSSARPNGSRPAIESRTIPLRADEAGIPRQTGNA